MTLAEILADIRAQLDWRGPTGRPQGHVVIPHKDAEVLYAAARKLEEGKDEPKGSC